MVQMLELATKISDYCKYVQELKEKDNHAERIDEDLRREMVIIKKKSQMEVLEVKKAI